MIYHQAGTTLKLTPNTIIKQVKVQKSTLTMKNSAYKTVGTLLLTNLGFTSRIYHPINGS